MGLYLGIDTSNYSTSAALYNSNTGEIHMHRQLLPVPEGRLGLRQSDAVFFHVKQLSAVLHELKEKYGMTAEVIDARTLVPFDYETVIASVKKTGRLVIVTDACERGSFASEVARQITEMAFDELDAPPVVVASKNWITPAHELEESFFPQPSWILDAIDAKIVPLKGHVRTTNQTLNQKLINERKGV